jgi:lysozyme
VKGRAAAYIAGGILLCSGGYVGLVDRWEDREQYTVYADRLANNLPTVCGGVTKHVTNLPVIVGEYWGPEKCDLVERAAWTAVQLALLECFEQAPPQPVFDAASDHAWNFGVRATCGSAAMKAWNRGDWNLGCRRLQLDDDGRPVWSYIKDGVDANGKQKYKFVRGLANRRAAERNVCEGN